MRSILHPGDRVRVRATGQIGQVVRWFETGCAFVRITKQCFPEAPVKSGGLYHRQELEKLR